MTNHSRALRLTVLGAGPAYTNRPGALGAAYLVEHDGTRLVLDLGQGTFAPLAATLEPSSLDAIVISHLHPDHFIDVVPLRHYLRWEFQPSRRVRVVAPRALAERVDALQAEPGFTAAALTVEALADGERYQVGSLEVEARRVFHTDDSYAFRVSVGGGTPGLVYTGDCGRADDVVPLVCPGDTLLSEVSFGPGPGDPHAAHLDGPAVGGLAGDTRAGRVLLTHLQMGFDREATVESVRSAGFDGDVQLVDPGFATAIG